LDPLSSYIEAHTTRGECDCGACFDRVERPDPTGHAADVVFFRVVATDGPDLDTFVNMTRVHHGVFSQCDPFDGQEHGYIPLGGWLGSQDIALRYMGLGALLGVFHLLTPYTVLGKDTPKELAMMAAQGGLVTVKVKVGKER
jgi:hypothetical protein